MRNVFGAPCHLLDCLYLALGTVTSPPFPHVSLTSFLHPNLLQAVKLLPLHLPFPKATPRSVRPKFVFSPTYSGLFMPCSGPRHRLESGDSLRWWRFCGCLVLSRLGFVRLRQWWVQLLSCADGRGCKTNWPNCFKTTVIKSRGFLADVSEWA